ncbi:MAG: GNAT family N-acetyltransferase [Chelatococcus sp.]|jgi:GNAT superfamily N-acetyltransferase|uniref:GNAT family N-acetyltransferase n=1 Tax=Chelatococcus sp. TaxID=1953771 RepID=UPI0025C57B88|nr:GNAT family N-acetyltransferase [Chelatococcus sp.]MBX3536191.1 GNAT family N-acetyltransferase [Chelatococcus sp.]
MTQRWLARPPIRPIGQSEFHRLRAAFRHEIGLWRCQGDENDPHIKVWNYRIGSTRFLTHIGLGDVHFGYFFGESMVGLISITLSADIGTVETLMSHPGQQGAGSMLIEHAVNALPSIRMLKLVSLDASRGFYERLGFVRAGRAMELDVTRSDAWQRVDGRWRIAAYVNLRGYLAPGRL